jgi:tRNA(adenine34) deaminase
VNHHLEITRGVLESECRDLLQAFFRLKRAEEPDDNSEATKP